GQWVRRLRHHQRQKLSSNVVSAALSAPLTCRIARLSLPDSAGTLKLAGTLNSVCAQIADTPSSADCSSAARVFPELNPVRARFAATPSSADNPVCARFARLGLLLVLSIALVQCKSSLSPADTFSAIRDQMRRGQLDPALHDVESA